MEVIVIAFAFILEDFAELFVEYFVVEKFITFYPYETSAQSFAAGISSVTLNLIALVSFVAFVMNFRWVFLRFLLLTVILESSINIKTSR